MKIKQEKNNSVYSIVVLLFSSTVMYKRESWTIKKAEGQRMMLLNCGAGEDS